MHALLAVGQNCCSACSTAFHAFFLRLTGLMCAQEIDQHQRFTELDVPSVRFSLGLLLLLVFGFCVWSARCDRMRLLVSLHHSMLMLVMCFVLNSMRSR